MGIPLLLLNIGLCRPGLRAAAPGIPFGKDLIEWVSFGTQEGVIEVTRIRHALLAAAGLVLTMGAPALAQGTYPPDPTGGSSITTETGGDLAFTGAEISVWMLVAGALILAGVVALFLGRRRAAIAE